MTLKGEIHLRIVVGSHNFTVDMLSDVGKRVCKRFASRFAQYDLYKKYGEWVKELKEVYASSAVLQTEYRFHINTLREFEQLCREMMIPEVMIQHVDRPMYQPVLVDLPMKAAWIGVEREEQTPLINYLTDLSLPRRFLGFRTGGGKMQPLDSLVKVPGSWKRMGDIQVGDMVTAVDGTPTRVDGVFPKGLQPIYRVTFADGRSTEAGADHLWKIFEAKGEVEKRWRVVDTLEVKRLAEKPQPRVYIPLCESEQSADISLPMDPYTLGALLGDGGWTTSRLSFTKSDPSVLEDIRSALPKGMKITSHNQLEHSLVNESFGGGNPYLKILRELELVKTPSWEKFIPEIYFDGSTQQRLALLQGLMDTDGTVNNPATSGAAPSFCSTSQRLALGVAYLVRSLGGIAKISLRQPSFTYKGIKKEGRMAYVVNIRFKKPSDLFRLPRKKERCNDNGQYTDILKLRVVSVEYIGEKEAQCISVEHPEHLYITDHFIVTHNTFCAATALSRIGQRVAIVVKADYIEKWMEDMVKLFDFEDGDVLVGQGSDDIKAILYMAQQGQLNAKVIILSVNSLQPYIKAYEDRGEAILDEGWPCIPPHFFEALGVGQRLIDEVHGMFHLQFKVDLFTHVPGSISLSATLITKNPLIKRMHLVMHPMHERCPVPPPKKYIDATAVHSMFERTELVARKARGPRGYSHNGLEKVIQENKRMLANYLRVIERVLEAGYFRVQRPKKGALIFASTVAMCTIIRDHLRKLYPELRIERYVGTMNDPYENLMEADIKVSTLGSASTGHDIPNLTNVLQTICVDSDQANVQSMGRLRELEEGMTQFHYWVYDDLPKTVEYHESKKIMLRERARSARDMDSGIII